MSNFSRYSFLAGAFKKNPEMRIFMRTLQIFKCWINFLKNKVICESNKTHRKPRCSPLASSLESLVSTPSPGPLWIK